MACCCLDCLPYTDKLLFHRVARRGESKNFPLGSFLTLIFNTQQSQRALSVCQMFLHFAEMTQQETNSVCCIHTFNNMLCQKLPANTLPLYNTLQGKGFLLDLLL